MAAPSADPSRPVRLATELEFMRLLWAVEHELQKTSKHMARHIGLTGPQRLSLRLIGQFPAIAPGELARLLRLHASTITGVLVRLERRGLITRKAHALDGRRAHLHVTAAGRRLNRPVPGTVEDAVKKLIARVGRRRLAVTEFVMTELAAALADARTPAASRGIPARFRSASQARR